MAHVGRLDHLEFLTFNNNPTVTAPMLAHLRGLTRMRDLDLSVTRVEDGSFLAEVAAMEDLVSLDLVSVNLADDDVAHLSGLRNLRTLKIGSPRLTDAGVAHLAGLTGLTELNLDLCDLYDAALPHLRGMVDLGSLNLSGKGITDVGLPHLRGMSKLKILCLSRTGVTRLDPLGPLKNLESLHLGRSEITDAGLANVAQTGLTHLSLAKTRVTDAGLASVVGERARIPRPSGPLDNPRPDPADDLWLRSLILRGCPITDAGLASRGRTSPGSGRASLDETRSPTPAWLG